jgi:hypothetical protein
MSEEKRDWKAEAEEALQKTGDSLSAAWDATREGRMTALEKAKEAARQLGDAIDHGVAAAKERWVKEDGSAAETAETVAETEAPTEEATSEEE